MREFKEFMHVIFLQKQGGLIKKIYIQDIKPNLLNPFIVKKCVMYNILYV